MKQSLTVPTSREPPLCRNHRIKSASLLHRCSLPWWANVDYPLVRGGAALLSTMKGKQRTALPLLCSLRSTLQLLFSSCFSSHPLIHNRKATNCLWSQYLIWYTTKGLQHHKCVSVVEPSTFKTAKLKRLQGLTQYVMYLHKLEKSGEQKSTILYVMSNPMKLHLSHVTIHFKYMLFLILK